MMKSPASSRAWLLELEANAKVWVTAQRLETCESTKSFCIRKPLIQFINSSTFCGHYRHIILYKCMCCKSYKVKTSFTSYLHSIDGVGRRLNSYECDMNEGVHSVIIFWRNHFVWLREIMAGRNGRHVEKAIASYQAHIDHFACGLELLYQINPSSSFRKYKLNLKSI